MNFQRPYVISWNLTYRCNLACEHCYLDAGSKKNQIVTSEGFEDRSELGTEDCLKIVDQIKEFAPESITILTGGEPLLRKDILEIIRYGSDRDLWMVMGTNGVIIAKGMAQTLKEAGLRGFALSLDALDPDVHDEFRRVKGAWKNTVQGARILDDANLSFIVQTTVGSHNLHEIEAIADFAYKSMNAKVFNLYFLVQTGRGQFVSDLTSDQYNEAMSKLSRIQKKYDGKMITSAKCAPHYIRHLYEKEPGSKFIKTFTGGAGGCPAGTQYMGIRPNGDVTPCPYLPVYGGNLQQESLEKIWDTSFLFKTIRKRDELKGNCGACEFNSNCGGCRARAFGVNGDVLQTDPLCDYEPGKVPKESIHFPSQSIYGLSQPGDKSLTWDADAERRMKDIPAFVRGMVKKSVESHCIKEGIHRVTLDELAKIRSRMPTPKVFGKFVAKQD